jgi:hypothetical protein
MQFKISFVGAFAALVAVSQAAYHVPADTADGHYRVQLDEHGNAVGAPLKISNSTSKRSAEILSRAQFPNPTVGCSGYGINLNDFSVTWGELDGWCNSGNWIAPGDEYATANELENDDCSPFEAAWVNIGDWGKSYGRDNVGAHICF